MKHGMSDTIDTLDAVDRAFLWHRDHTLRQHVRTEAFSVERKMPTAAASRPSPTVDVPITPGTTPESLVDRLLRTVPKDFERLASRVEQAHEAGDQVIAITGARRGEGRTTLVECLARSLATRGRRVECHPGVPLSPASAVRRGGSIVLVDCGVWFPGGPLRRSWLEQQSLGCHAVILVRRVDRPACEARGRMLESLGLHVLGEVLTMTPSIGVVVSP